MDDNDNDRNENNKVNVYLLFEALGKVLSEKYGCKITFTVKPKNENDSHDNK